jgi:hypothetical protein
MMEMRRGLVAIGSAAVLGLAMAGCGTADAAAPGPHVVTVTARDFAFEAPETVPAGLVTFRLVNQGPDLHHVALVRLEGGKTLADLAQHQGPPPAWAVDMGGPNAVVPGASSEATVFLRPGSYALLCFVPTADGTPHLMMGMAKALTVAGPAPERPLPEADVTLALNDYSFGWQGPTTAGDHVVRVRNDAAQSHEVVLVKLAPGKHATDVMAWLEGRQGPPPGMPVGGVVGLARGQENTFPLRLEAGRYALLCFIPDAKDGKPHVAHGMFREFTVE